MYDNSRNEPAVYNMYHIYTCMNTLVYYSRLYTIYMCTCTDRTDNLVFIEIGDNRVILLPIFSLHKLQNTMKILSMLQGKTSM